MADKNAKKWYDIEKSEPNIAELNDPNRTGSLTLIFNFWVLNFNFKWPTNEILLLWQKNFSPCESLVDATASGNLNQLYALGEIPVDRVYNGFSGLLQRGIVRFL